jgi:hypothetical protein
VISGDWEKAGEGTFTVGATLLGAKVGPKTIKGAKGVEYTMKGGDGILGKTTGYFKSLMPGKMGKVYEAADGTMKSGLELGKESVTNTFSNLGSKIPDFLKFGKNKGENSTPLPEEGTPSPKGGSTTTTSTESNPVKVNLTPDKDGQVKVEIKPTEQPTSTTTESNPIKVNLTPDKDGHINVDIKPTESEGATTTTGKGIKDRLSKYGSKLQGSPQTSGMIMSTSIAGGMGEDGPSIPGLPEIPGLTQHQ